MNRIRERNRQLLVFIWIVLILPFLSVQGIRSAMGTSVYQGWQFFSMLVTGALVVYMAEEIRINLYSVLFTLFQGLVFVNTAVHSGISLGILVVMLMSVFLFLLLQTDFYSQLLQALAVLVIALVLINLPGLFLRSGDENEMFFISGKNGLSIFLVPGAFFILFQAIERYGKLRWTSTVGLGLCLLSVIVGSSGTGVVVTAVAAILLLLAVKFKPPKWVYIAVILALYAILILFSETLLESKFWLSFTELLGKDGTLTSRMSIWKTVKRYIGRYWLIGVGRGARIRYINSLGMYRFNYEAHNFVLEILLESGVIGLLLYGTLLFYTIRHLNMNDLKQRMVFVALCVLLVNGLTESTLNSCFVTLMLGIACRYAAENRRNLKPNEHKV